MVKIDSHTAEICSRDLLVYACGSGNLGAVKLLVNRGVSVTKTNRYGIYPLFAAVAGGNYETTEYLISKGANVNQIVSIGNGIAKSNLIIEGFCRNNKDSLKIAKLLLDSGFDKNIVEKGDDLSLGTALDNVNRGNSTILKFLIKNFNTLKLDLCATSGEDRGIFRRTSIFAIQSGIPNISQILKESLVEVFQENGVRCKIPTLLLRLGMASGNIDNLLNIIYAECNKISHGTDNITLKLNILSDIQNELRREIRENDTDNTLIQLNGKISDVLKDQNEKIKNSTIQTTINLSCVNKQARKLGK